MLVKTEHRSQRHFTSLSIAFGDETQGFRFIEQSALMIQCIERGYDLRAQTAYVQRSEQNTYYQLQCSKSKVRSYMATRWWENLSNMYIPLRSGQ